MYHVVLAGGRGTRFWPLSRKDRPKQLVRLWSDQTMLQATASRLRDAPNHQGLFVLAPETLRSSIFDQLPDLPESHFVTQPEPRGTLPAIALVAAAIGAVDEDATIGIFPADHFVGDEASFHRCLASAERHTDSGAIVTIGIEPTRPETEFGYIRRGASPIDAPSDEVGSVGEFPAAFSVEKFEEKPDETTAREYLKTGDYLWNSGMFFARISAIFRELERATPAGRAAANTLKRAFDRNLGEPDLRAFYDLPEGSFDSDVVEQAEQVRVIPGDIGWSDVGQWSSIDSVFGQDDEGNTVRADHSILADCSETVVFDADSAATSRLVAAIDLNSMVVVQTDDSVLIVPRDGAHRVRDIYRRLERDGRTGLLRYDSG